MHLTLPIETKVALNSAEAWNDLWLRSECASPTLQAESLALWREQFAPQARFDAISVESGDRLLAVLPLVRTHTAEIFPAASLPSNPWLLCGNLLLDPLVDVDAVCDELVRRIRDASIPLLRLNECEIDSPRWLAFQSACDRANMETESRFRYEVARIEIADDFEAFFARLSRSHRHAMRKASQRLAETGEVKLRRVTNPSPEKTQVWLEKALLVEDSGWKRDAGTSVLQTPGMADFFLNQARVFAARGQLEIALLEVNGRAVASMFGFSAKGILFAHKIGYDPRFAEFGPGQILFLKLIESLHADGGWKAVDCVGPITEAIARWRPARYRVGRLLVAPGSLSGKLYMSAYKNFAPLVRKLRDWRNQ